MQMKNSKNGISIVVLVITVILIILLTATVMVNPVNPVTEVQIVTLQSSIKTIEEAVNLKVSDNMIKYANEKNRTLYKWVNVISGYTESMAAEGTQPTSVKTILGTIKVYNIDDAIQTTTSITKEELANYLIDEQGNVYYDEFEYEDEIYYAANIKKMEWAEEIEENNNLNEDTPCVTQIINDVGYVIPIPKGFVPSNIEGEKTVSEGFVIYDTEVSPTRNQFVWVPVDNTYKMIGDITGDGTFHNMQTSSPYNYDIPYLSNNTTTALAYWQASASGHSGTITSVTASSAGTYTEPYSSAGSWETTEYQAMLTSVLKYGGFYVGRYETGGSASVPVVKAEVLPITNIKWNGTSTMTAEPTSGTAPYVARNMYPSTNTTYGGVSTLIYGIQWDSIICWAKCYNEIRTNTGSLANTGSVSSDCYKNIYDLAGNVREWSMEAKDTSRRVIRGAYYNDAYAVSIRYNLPPSGSGNSYASVGFRTALYVK